MKYYLDEDISPKGAFLLRQREIDVKSSHEADRNGTSDMTQLEFASQEGRSLVTRNRNDFILLTVRFFQEQRPHGGVLIVPSTIPAYPLDRLVKTLAEYAKSHPDGLPAYVIDFLKG